MSTSRTTRTRPGSVSLALFRAQPRPCPYLPGRSAVDEFTFDNRVDSRLYGTLMDRGFRRSGRVFYRPVCSSCHECQAIRVAVAGFQPSRSQRRVLRRNADLAVTIESPASSDEKWRIYERYLEARHDDSMSRRREDFEEFLYRSPIDTLEMTYRLGRRMVAVGLVDVAPHCLSSVYFYYDPEYARRSLGVFSGLREIDECARRGLPYWYVGFYVRDCRLMNYKSQFRPFELLGEDGTWQAPATSDIPRNPPNAP